MINSYQYTCKSHRAADRSSLLQKLDELLHNIPRRNLLYIGGDFNTTMAILSEVVGVRSYRFQQRKQHGKIHQDWDELHSLCLRHHLIALNTWCMDSPPTFSSPTGHSRIDYIFARKQMMDCTSKQVHHLTDFPLLITNGNNHIPLVAEVPSKWIFNPAPRQRGWSKHARDNLYQGWKYDTPYWQIGTEALQEKLVNFNASPDLQLHAIHEDFNQCFPITSGAQQTKQAGGNMELFKQFLTITISLTRSNCADLEDGFNGLAFCFKTWRNWFTRQKLRRQMKQLSKHKRKQKIQSIMQGAQMAAQSKDQYELFQHIRKLAPKSTHNRIMLRDHNGQLCNPSQAADLLAQWIQDVYAGPRTTLKAMVWPFEATELKLVFQTFMANKALAPLYLPSLVWKHFATDLSHVMHQQATGRTVNVPHLWNGDKVL